MKGLKDIIGIDYGKLQDELHKEMSESEQNTRERQEQAYMDEARRNAREFDLPTRERTLKDDFAQGFGAFEPARRQLRKDEQVAENLSTDYMAYVGSKDVAKAANAFDLPEMQRNYAISPTRHVGIERSQDFTVDEKQRREVERPTHKSSEYAEARAVRPGERGDDGRIFRRTLGGIMPEARHDTFGFAKIAKSRRDNQAERLANNFNSLLEDAMSFEPGNYNTDQYRAKSDTIAAAEGNLRELVRRERDYDDKLYSFFDTDEGKRVARPILDKYSDDKAREAAKMYDIDEDTAVQRVTAEREKRLQEAFEGSDYYQKWLFGTQYGQAYNALNKAQRLNAAKYLDVDTSKQQKDIDNMNLAQSIDESKDYYKQELDRLEKEATEKDIKEGWVDENTRRYMLSGGRLSPINMPSENQKTLEAAARAYNDIAETQAEYLREGNTTALGRFFRGAGNAATDKRTWDFGFSHLNDAVELEKAAQAVEQGKATKAQELLVNLSALKNVVTSEYGDVLGGMYGAGRTTTEMLPFMLQMIMTPTTGVIRAATGKIAGVLAKKMGKEAAEKAARFFAEKLTGKVIKTIGKGVQKVAEATERGTVAQALYGMPTTLADTQERMTGMIKAGTSDDGKIVYTVREKGDGLIDAARKSYIANNLEYTTEMLGSLFRPATQAMKRGVKAFTDYATKNGINLSKIYDFFAMTDKKGMVQIWDKFAKKGFYDGPVGEYGEEVINNLGNALLVGDLNFNSPDDPNSVFNPELNLDTFLAVAMGSAFMGGLGRINYGATILQKRAADHRLNAKLENWDRLKDELASKATANDALKEGLERITYYEKNGSVSHNEAESLKKSLADYAQITWWQKGLDMREEKEQEAAEDTQADNTGTTAQDAATVDVVTAGQGEAVNAGQQPVQSPTDVLTSVNTESMPSAGEAVDVDPGREYRSAGRDFAAAEAELDDRENSNDHNKAAAAQIIKSSSDLFTAQAILNERALDTEDNLALAERYFSSLERSKALEDEMLARANEETDNIIHKDTDSVVEVTDRDGNAGYVISGGVSVEDDGTVSATDDTVMVKSADGTVRQIPAVELQFTTPATSRDDYAHRLQARMQVRNDVPEPVAGIAFTDDDGIRHTVTGVDTAGNIVVSDDLGETTTISRDDYNYFMSNALDMQEEQTQAAGQVEAQPQEYRPVTESATAEQPQNVEHSSTDVQGTGENVPAVEKNVENIQQEAPQEVDEVSKEERSEMENRIVDWLSEDNLSKAYGKTREEIFNEFGNELEPIAYIPAQFISLVDPELTDTRIYCGKGYFIDHALRNHAGSGRRIAPEDVDVSKYLNMQYVLDNPDSIKETVSDGKRTVVFIKKIGRYFAELTQVEENGKIVLHKSLFNQKKEPYAKLDDIRSKQTSPEGGVSSISHADNAAPAISLESRDDVNRATSAGKDSKKVANDEAGVENIPQGGQTGGVGGRKLTGEEAEALVSEMETNAEIAPEVELTPDNWVKEFGENGIVDTPVGKVKIGENQYLKLLKNKRDSYFGMIKPTLTNPDVILEEYDPKEGAERDTKYLFIKTFVKPDGSRVVHFESVTVQKDNLEVSISSHEINEKALTKKVYQNNLIHLNEKFSSSEWRLTEPRNEGSDLVPTPNSVSSESKDNEKPEEIPTDGKGNLLYSEVPVEKTVAYLYNSGLTDEEIQGFIEANIAASREKYERLAQKQPKIGTDIAKYKAKKAQWRSSVDGAKKQYDYWQAVDTYIKEQTHTTEEEVSAARAELEGDNARREYASISGDIQGDAVVTAAQFISDKKITPESFRRETGYGKDEQRRFVGMIASKEKGGESIERLAERLAEDDADNNNGALYHGDDYNAKSAILEALQRYGTRGALKKGEDDMLADKYAEEKAEERDAHYMDAYHMDYADYLAAREQEMPDIWRKYGNFDKDEYYSLYAEEIEQRLKGIENEQRTDSEREEPADDRSDKVLPGERLDDGGGIAESAEPERKGDNGNGSPVPHGYVQEGSSAGEVAEKIAQAEAETDTSPTEAQKEAGNYKKGHVRIDGFDITIENPKGSVRSGVDANGTRWENTMNNTYGYMRGTEGVDGDHIDVFLSDNPEEGNVYVVDQQNPDTGEFDEHKVMYGFNSMEEAKEAYLANYTPGWKGLGTITEVSKDEFKRWINSSHRKTKPFAEYKSVKKEDGKNEGENTLANEAHYLFSELISKSTHNVDINDKEVFETENTLYAPINIDGKRTNLSLYETEPVLSSEEPIVGVSYYRDGLTYQEASDLSEEYNRQAGKTVCMDGDDDLGINFGNIDEAVRFEEWLKYRGTLPVNEAAIRDAVVERLRESGIDVITDTEAGQRVLDEANGKQKISLETDSVPEEEHLRTVISSDSGAKVLKNIDNLINEYENSSYTKEKTFIGNIAKALSARQYGSGSEYATFETVNGKIVTIRLANHSASSKRMDNAGRDNAISIVISSKPNTGVFNDGKAHIVEFYYNAMKLRRAGGKPLVEILKSIKQALYSGEYKDTTGLAEVQEVNGDTIREHRVYHGSGADFEAFDHSHMGEGEGAQAYGWGSYVTEVEGIGRTYAEERRISETDVDDELATRMADYEADSDSVSEPDYATREHFGIDEPVFLEDGYSVGDADEAKLARQAATYYGRDIDLENEEDVEEIIDELLGDMTDYYNEEYARRRNEYESNLREELEARQTVHLYTVEIPDDTGENYLDWKKGPTEKQGKRIREALLAELDSRGMRSEENIAGLERQWKLAYEADGRIGGAIYYNIIRRVAGSDKAASELLSKIGFTGISYPAQATTGGRADGARNYVIFDEKDLKITDHVRFFRTENGEAYGFTAGGKIYLDPRMATIETPIHEYSHLWASVLREANPNEWKHIAELLKGTPVWDEVKRRYPELETDDEIADEVLATYSGRRGAERLRDEARKIAEGKGSPIDKAEAVSALRRVREALQRFWKGVADFLHIHYASAEDVADRVMRDLAEGVNPQKSPKGNMQNPAVEKIEDVGEKIGGARKDRFAEYMEKSKQVEDKPESFMEQLRKLPVSKMFNFPLDALRKDGLSNEAATLIDIIRRMIPAKPRSEWKLKRWTENVFRLYRMCLTLGTADKKMLDDILERIQRERIISGMYRAQMALGGFDSGKDTGTAMLEQLGDNAGHYDKNGEWVSAKGQWYVSHAGRYGGIYPDFEKAKEVLEKFAGENTKTSGSKKDVQFSVYMSNADKSCFITVKGKPDMVVQSGFKTAKDATNYLNEHIDDLREKYRNFKESTNIGFRPNGERIGKDWRGGKDVAAEDFRKAFGFRGVEFGNWTNQKERQSALNQAYDAFMDLSEATGISPQGLSLGGELGIAFGARGGGKAAAHYESGKVVINLTKTQGAGTLAHEWWHAIDNYFSRRRGHSAGYNTERRDYKLTREDGKLKRTDEKERTEITDAFGELMKAIEESDYGKRSNRYASIKSNYWKDPTELGARAFAVWVERKLSEKGIVDDFLANNNTLGWGSPELTQKYFPYPMESDFESLDTAFDNLFNAIEEKTDEETGNTILYRFIGEKGATRLDAAEEANMQETNERFNEELDKFEKGTMRSSDKFNLGAPSQILLSSGLPNSNIEMTQSVLRGHLVKHGISVNDIKNLPVALQNPIMVYEWGDKARSAVIITDLSLSDGRKVTAAIRVEKNGERLSINEISSIHGKEIERLLNDMNTTKSDFGKDNLKYVDKEKALNWFAMASPKEASQTNSRLLSAANIVENFRNPEIKGENLRDVVAEYAAEKSPEAVARRNAERKERITGRVRAFAEENGLGEIDIIESADDARVPDRVRREIEGGSVVSGWYDTRTGRVALYYPTVTDEADALRTVAHEAIGHKGLRAVIGEDTYNEFLDYVDKNADEDIAKRINAKESETGSRRVAVDEVLAEIAEREAGEPVHLNLWQRIAGWIRDALRRIGIDTEITVGQAQYYIWRSRRNAGKGGLTDTARDTVMRRKTKAKDVLNISAGMRTSAESEAETLQEVNERFNEELSGLTEENAQSKILYLGNPGKILLAAGISDKPIKLYGNKLLKKMHKHDFTIAAVKNLPIEINNPIAVFKGSVENSFAILSELKINGNNVLASLTIGKGNDIEFNIISSIYGKDSNSVVFWINRGKTLYVNKEKALNYLRISAPIAEAQDNQELDSAANIINNFENPETGEENIRFRKSPRQRAIEAADNAVRTYRESAADLYHNTLERSMFRFTEAFQDGMRSVKVLVDSILTSRGESINDLKEYEDAYRAENHCASKSMNEFDQYRNRLYNPVIEAARRVMETSGLDTDGLRHYLFAKSGLERNREFTVRDIYKIADKANDEAQRRYATAKRKVEEAKASDEWKTLTGEEKKELELATSNAEKRADEKKAALDATEAIVNEYRELEERMYLELENGDIGFEEYCDTLDEFVTKRIDKDYDPAKTDYSGLASIFKGEKDYKQAALALVRSIEGDRARRSTAGVNDAFNEALGKLTEENADGVTLMLGRPSEVLRAAGVEDKPMKLYGNKVIKKMKKHGFALAGLKNLPEAVANPIAVFDNYQKEGNRSILTELKTSNGNFLVTIDLGKDADVDFNIVTSVFGKGNNNVVDWINKGYATYINKEKAQEFLSHQSALIAATAANSELDSAANIVENFENPKFEADETGIMAERACNDLWKRIKTATDYLLSKQAEGGLISHSQADMLKKRSNWYVPMRGWNGITTADVYDYVNNWNKTQGRRKEKEAGGRGSEAGDPIAQIIYIAQNTIEEANRNEVKQRFLDFVLNHMSDLATVHPAWVRLNEKGEWEYAAPDIEEGDSAEQIEQKIKTFEANMQAEKEAGRASKINSKARLNVDMVVIPRTEDEHTVLVRRGGRMFTIIINGNPRAAQALNGWLQRQQQGDVARVFNRAMRGIAMLITSKAPNFILRNGMRDFGYAADTLMVREGKDYAARFLKNYAAIIPAREHSIFKLLEKFKEGTLDTEHDDVERMFSEFMLNGAETGYINYQNVEKWRSDIENLLKKDPKGITEKGKKNLKKAWKGTWDYIEKLNRGAEDLVRFATYMTSRQEGRSIFTSVDNAKNVSVNFNRSGAGYNGQGWWRYPAGFMRGWFMFFNAGVQGLTNFLYNFKAAPGRSTARAIARGIAGSIVPYFTLGFLNGLLHGLYGGDDGDDDGKDGYFDLTDYTRRTNFIIGGFGDYYIMLPLPIELRAFYGAGEAFAGVLTGKQHAEDVALSAVASLFELLPVNPVEMYKNPANLAGGVFSPIAQAVMNKNFMGVPLYKDTPWNEEAPAYTKAYAGTPKILVDISRSINELTGGNEYKTGWLGKTDNVINNPAITYHLLRSYLGGVAQVFGQVFNLMGDYIVPNAETAITGEGEYNTDRIFREIPFFSVLITQNDERTGYSLTNKLYHDMKEQADRRKDLLGKYLADGNKQEEINEMLEDSKANAKDDVILFYDGILKDLNEQAKGSTEEESEQIKITINKVRKAAVLNASEAAGEPLTLNMPQTRLQEQLGTGEAYIAEHMTIPDALEEGELRRLKSQASKNPNTIKNKITLTIIRRYESFKRKMSDAMEYSDDMGYNLNTIREARKGMLEYLRGM